MTNKLTKILLILCLFLMTVGFSVRGYPGKGGGAAAGGGITGLAKTCKYIESMNATGETFGGLLGHFFADVDAVSMWCRSEGGTNVIVKLLENVDGSATLFSTGGSGFTCADTDAGSTDNFTDRLIDAGNEIDLEIVSTSGSPASFQVCVEFEEPE